MKVSNVVRLGGRAGILAVIVTGMLGATAWGSATTTIGPTAQLSPGHLHAYMTGTVTCEVGKTVSLSGQVVQSKGVSGFGYANLDCNGTSQAYTIDASGAGGFPGGLPGTGVVFKPGKASAGLTATVCDPFVFPDPTFPFPTLPFCESTSSDAMIRLVK
jgi:hypothetical protein